MSVGNHQGSNFGISLWPLKVGQIKQFDVIVLILMPSTCLEFNQQTTEKEKNK